MVIDSGGMQIDLRKLLGDQIQQIRLGEALDVCVKIEAFENIAHGRREGFDVAVEIIADVILIARQFFSCPAARCCKNSGRICAAGTDPD